MELEPGVTCSDPGGAIDQWITNYPDPSIGDLPLNYPNPTYVCRASGNRQSTWDDLANLAGQTLFFPINRCDNTLPGNLGGQLLPKSSSEASLLADARPVRHHRVLRGEADQHLQAQRSVAGGTGSCSGVRTFPGPNNPFNVYSMFEATQPSPCPSSAPDLISNVAVGKVKKNDPGPAPVLGTDYVVDYTNPSDPSITWLPSGPANENQDYKVTFDWSTTGKCGVPPSGNNSGHCMILQPVEVQIGGSHPGGGMDSNVRAYKLCDPNVSRAHVAR